MKTIYVRIGEPEHHLFREVRIIPLREVLEMVCAWCPGFDPRDPKNRNATHGMCAACAARFNKERA
jgi:hypothetical protein